MYSGGGGTLVPPKEGCALRVLLAINSKAESQARSAAAFSPNDGEGTKMLRCDPQQATAKFLRE